MKSSTKSGCRVSRELGAIQYAVFTLIIRGVQFHQNMASTEEVIVQPTKNTVSFEFKEGNLKGNKPKEKEIIRRLNIFREMNPKISRYVYSNCASRFQFQDSEIARSIINECMHKLIPVLCIHDSFIVEYTHSNFIVDAMNSAIEDAGFTSVPLIK